MIELTELHEIDVQTDDVAPDEIEIEITITRTSDGASASIVDIISGKIGTPASGTCPQRSGRYRRAWPLEFIPAAP